MPVKATVIPNESGGSSLIARVPIDLVLAVSSDARSDDYRKASLRKIPGAALNRARRKQAELLLSGPSKCIIPKNNILSGGNSLTDSSWYDVTAEEMAKAMEAADSSAAASASEFRKRLSSKDPVQPWVRPSAAIRLVRRSNARSQPASALRPDIELDISMSESTAARGLAAAGVLPFVLESLDISLSRQEKKNQEKQEKAEAEPDPASDWLGSTPEEAIVTLRRRGWQDGERRIAEVQNELRRKLMTSEHEVARVNVVNFVLGEDPSLGTEIYIPAFVAGDRQHWIEHDALRANRQIGNIMQLVVDVTAPIDARADDIIRRAIIIGALLDLAVQSGRSVEIVAYAGFTSPEGADRVELYITVSEGREVSAATLALMGHPAFLRMAIREFLRSGMPEHREFLQHIGIGSGIYAYPAGKPSAPGDIFIPFSVRSESGTKDVAALAEEAADLAVSCGLFIRRAKAA